MNDIAAIPLPTPDQGPNQLILSMLKQRRTTREISDEPLSQQQLANLLWAAYGVNRLAGPLGQPGRTASSASCRHEIDIYVALKEGTYLYDAVENRLTLVNHEDLRSAALGPGLHGAFSKAGVQLIYVADLRRLIQGMDGSELQDPEVQKSYYYVDTGLIAGNVYVYAAAVGLAAWFHDCDRARLARQLGFKPEQRVLFAQSVGYPQNVDE